MSRLSTSTLFSIFMPLCAALSFLICMVALYVHPPKGQETLFGDALAVLIGLAIVLWGIPILVAIKRLPPPPHHV